MIDMSIGAEEKKEMSQLSVVDDKPMYPYGLKLHLDPKSVEKLGLNEIPKIGDKMVVLAQVEVCGLYQEKTSDDVPKFNMDLQITSMDVKKPQEKKTAEDALYGSSDSKEM